MRSPRDGYRQRCGCSASIGSALSGRATRKDAVRVPPLVDMVDQSAR